MSDGQPNTCPTCGAEIPSAAPGGLCPRCALGEAVLSPLPSDNDDTATTAAPASSDDDRTLPLDPSRRPTPSPRRQVPADDVASPPDPKKGAQQFAPSLEELAELFPELEIIELLGAGGMGAVYKARQPRLDRLVALKILSCPAEYHDNFALRFEREAQLLAKLNHPNIVTIFDFGEVERSSEEENEANLFYFLMEYVDGADLNRLIHDGGLESAQALRLVPQICDALQFAHDEGITHRDIKPANILVDLKGNVRIADFGLAKLIEADQAEAMMTGLTMTGTSMGTPHYMAPEQWDTPEKVDHRADIYSLGVVFYEMLTGERPHGIFTPPSEKSEVDDRIDTVVLKAMEKEPDLRYQQASEVKEDVTRVVSEPVEVVPASKSRMGLWVGVCLAVVAVFGVVIWQQGFAPEKPEGFEEPDLDYPHQVPSVRADDGEQSPNPGGGEKLTVEGPPGRLRAVGTQPNGDPPDLSKVAGFDDLVDVGGRLGDWVALRANGDTISSDGKADFEGIRRIASTFDQFFALIDMQGKIRFPKDRSQELPPDFDDARIVDVQLGDEHGIALAEDGRALVFGKRYEEQVNDPTAKDGYGSPRWPTPPAEILDNVKDIAVTMTHAAVLQENGTLSVFGWEGVRDLPPRPKEMGRIDAIGSNHDRIFLLDSEGQVWKHALPRNPAPDQPVVEGGKWFDKLEMTEPAIALKGGLWKGESGRWHAEGEKIDKLLEEDKVGGDGRFASAGGVHAGKFHRSLLWIEPADARASTVAKSPRSPGRLQGGGVHLDGSPFDLTKAEGIDDFVQVIMTDSGWVGLRSNGEQIISDEAYRPTKKTLRLLPGSFRSYGYIDEVHRLTIRRHNLAATDIPEDAQRIGVVDAHWQEGFAIALLRDGTVRAWGDVFEGPFAPRDFERWPALPPEDSSDVIDIACNQNTIAWLSRDGRLHTLGGAKNPTHRKFSPVQPGHLITEIESSWTDVRVLDSEGSTYHVRSSKTALGDPQEERIHAIHDIVSFPEGSTVWTWSDGSRANAQSEMDAFLKQIGDRPGDAFDLRIVGTPEEPKAAAVWIEAVGALATSLTPAYPADEAGFREWLEGKVLPVTERPDIDKSTSVYWISDGKIHYRQQDAGETEPRELRSWPYDVRGPGIITWEWMRPKDDHRIQITADGQSFEKHFPGGHAIWKGQVRTDVSPPGRLRAIGTSPNGDPPDLSKVEAFDDIIDVGGRIGEWVALRANGETISAKGDADFKNIRRISPSIFYLYVLIDSDGKLRFAGDDSSDLPHEFKDLSFVDAQLGLDHGIALTDTGRAVVFGERYEKQVGDLTDTGAWGTPQWPQPPAEVLSDVKDIAVTSTHAATLKHDGTLSIFGWEGLHNPADLAVIGRIQAIGSSGDLIMILDEEGRIWNHELPRNPLPDQPVKGAGKRFSLVPSPVSAVTLSGKSWRGESGRWYSAYEEIENVFVKNPISADSRMVANASVFHSKAFHSILWIEPADAQTPKPLLPESAPGRLRGFKTTSGDDEIPLSFGGLGELDDLVQIRSTADAGVLQVIALRRNGKVEASGLYDTWRADVNALNNLPKPIRYLGYNFASLQHLVVIDQDGRPHPLLPNHPVNRDFPIPAEEIVDVQTTEGQSLMLTVSGIAIPWGPNYQSGTEPAWPMPDENFLKEVSEIAVIADAFVLRRFDNTVVAWGKGGEIALPEPFKSGPIVSIASKSFRVGGLDEKGRLWITGGLSEALPTLGNNGEPMAEGIECLKDQTLTALLCRDENGNWISPEELVNRAEFESIISRASRFQNMPPDAFNTGGHREAASRFVLWIESESADPSSPEAGTMPGERREFEIAPNITLAFRWCPPGKFLMGSPESEVGRAENETQHPVTLTKGFWLAETEFSRESWESITEKKAKFTEQSSPGGPVVGVSWNQIAGPGGFLDTIQDHAPEGWRFDLPTEAQWEYACRAGTTSRFFFDAEDSNRLPSEKSKKVAYGDFANLSDVHSSREHRIPYADDGFGDLAAPVGSFKPNSWGLHDMIGNVSEFSHDWIGDYPGDPAVDPVGPESGTEKVMRGGSFINGWADARSSNRQGIAPDFAGSPFAGFRLVLVEETR